MPINQPLSIHQNQLIIKLGGFNSLTGKATARHNIATIGIIFLNDTFKLLHHRTTDQII